MSDGPLYCPKMSKPCQKLADSCENDAFRIEERVEHMKQLILYLMIKEGGETTVKVIKLTFSLLDGDLFQDNRAEALEAMRNQIPNTALAQSILDNIIELTRDGYSEIQAEEIGLENSIKSRIKSEGRGINELYSDRNKVSQGIAAKVADNLDCALIKFDTYAFAKNLIKNGSQSVLKNSKKKEKSLEKGPPM